MCWDSRTTLNKMITYPPEEADLLDTISFPEVDSTTPNSEGADGWGMLGMDDFEVTLADVTVDIKKV